MNSFIKFILPLIFIIPFPLLGQSTKKDLDDQTITITQKILPGPNWDYNYLISPKRINIYKTKYLSNSDKTRKRKVYNMKLNRRQLDSLDYIIDALESTELYDYSAELMDGVIWTFDFEYEKIATTIRLENYYLPPLGVLVDFINRQLPKKKRFITFDIFNVRENQENK